MGLLTPILIRNDCLSDIKRNRIEVTREIVYACQDVKKGGLLFGMESLGCRHADQDRLIVISGNGWVDLSEENSMGVTRTDEIWTKNLEEQIRFTHDVLKELKKKIEVINKRRRDREGGSNG